MNEELVLRSEKQYQRTVNTQVGRGSIFDRNMNELATNIDVESVYATPHEVLGKKQAARTIASALNLNQKSVYEKLRLDRHFVWLKRKAAPTEVARLRNSSLSGVNFTSEDKRFYPKRELASGAIGFVGIDNQGLAGIEHQFQSTLKGNTIRTVMEKDARGRPIRIAVLIVIDMELQSFGGDYRRLIVGQKALVAKLFRSLHWRQRRHIIGA